MRSYWINCCLYLISCAEGFIASAHDESVLNCWALNSHNQPIILNLVLGVKWSEVAPSCPTLCDPWTVAYQAPPSLGFSRQEYWSGLPFPSPKGNYGRKKVKSLSRVWLFATPWTVAYQAPPSVEFSRQEYWNGLPFPSPYHLISSLLFLWLFSFYFINTISEKVKTDVFMTEGT